MMATLREICETTKRHMEGRQRFRDDVVDVAVKHATGCTSQDEIVEAVTAAFEICRLSINPNWDGSIA